MTIDEQIKRESCVHGKQWNSLHNGYFSDALIARPFIETIIRYLSDSAPEVIVDLGGGTGFILRELIAKGVTANIFPVNLDCSETQLDAMGKRGIPCINCMISDFSRNDLVFNEEQRVFFIMRSVLHYFGQKDLIDILQHIRNQAQKGEMFIHQSACFENEVEARCLNALYQEMGSPKWYPVIKETRDKMMAANWQVIEECPAPPLQLLSAELGQRYGVTSQVLSEICDRIINEFGEIENIFQCTSDGFVACLNYRIFVARAV
ncbi:MAG: class I SAM-dependent methyltransferase [Smithella sp.]